MRARHTSGYGPFWIYQITNAATDGVYIGQTNRPKHRFAQHLSAAKTGVKSRLCNSIRFHGRDKFSFVVIDGPFNTIEEIDAAEIHYIGQLEERGIKHYNVSRGGGGGDAKAASDAATRRLRDDPEHRQRVADRLRALRADPAFREKQAAASSKTMLALHKNPEFVQRLLEAAREVNSRPEVIAAKRERLQALNADPSFAAARDARARLKSFNGATPIRSFGRGLAPE